MMYVLVGSLLRREQWWRDHLVVLCRTQYELRRTRLDKKERRRLLFLSVSHLLVSVTLCLSWALLWSLLPT